MTKISLNPKDAFEYYGFKLVVPQQVYSPSDDTDLSIFFLKKWVQNFNESPYAQNPEKSLSIFDMGVGSGILSIFLASRLAERGYRPHIWGVDINPYAVQTTHFNAQLNQVDQCMTLLEGKITQPLQNLAHKPMFDFIVSNPPYLGGEPKTINPANRQWIDYAWEGGLEGYEVTLEFLAEAAPFMKPTCDLMLISSSNVDQDPVLDKFSELGFHIMDTLSTHIFFEDILLYHCRREE